MQAVNVLDAIEPNSADLGTSTIATNSLTSPGAKVIE